MTMSVRLKAVSIQGFRGYGKAEQHVDLSAPVVLLFGKNRSGKSSTLNAIEWAIYGDEVAKKALGIPERTKWLTANMHADAMRVSLTLETEKGEIRVERGEGRSGKKKTKEFRFVDEDGVVSEDEEELHKRLGLEAKDFMASVYLHQEVIRDILVTEPRVREEALSRLLGTSGLRSLQEAFKGSKRKEVEGRIDATYQKLSDLLERESDRRKRSADEARTELAKKGLAKKDCGFEGFRAQCEAVLEKLVGVAGRAGVETGELAAPATLEGYVAFRNKVNAEIDRLRSSTPLAASQKELVDQRTRLERLKSEFGSRQADVDGLQSELDSLIAETGGEDALVARIGELEESASETRKRMELADDRFLIWKDTLSYLEKIEDKRATTDCPACGQPIVPAELLEALQRQEQACSGEVTELQEAKGKLEGEASELRGKLERLAGLRDAKVPDARQKAKAGAAEIAAALGREISEQDDPVAFVEKRLTEIQRELENLNKQMQQYNELVRAVEGALETAGMIREVVRAERQAEKIEQIPGSPLWQELDRQRDAVFNMLDALDKVAQAVNEVAQDAKRSKLAGSQETIAEYYGGLVQRPDFDSIEVDTDKGEVFATRDGERKSLVTFFNQGDMNCAALSIFLALGGGRSGAGPAFVILDDPSQSLDADQKVRLANLLDRVSEGCQVVLATMDEQLLSACRTCMTKRKNVFEFGDWHPIAGPSIERSA